MLKVVVRSDGVVEGRERGGGGRERKRKRGYLCGNVLPGCQPGRLISDVHESEAVTAHNGSIGNEQVAEDQHESRHVWVGMGGEVKVM